MLPLDMTLDPFHIGKYKGQIWVEAYWVDAQGNKYSNVVSGELDSLGTLDESSIEARGGIASSVWLLSSPTNW